MIAFPLIPTPPPALIGLLASLRKSPGVLLVLSIGCVSEQSQPRRIDRAEHGHSGKGIISEFNRGDQKE